MARTITIQPRDIAIFESLAAGRYLTAQAIEWLHYPCWRQRVRDHTKRVQHETEQIPYQPTANAYNRLRALREQELIAVITRVSNVGAAHDTIRSTALLRVPQAYTLLVGGAQLLGRARDIDLADIPYDSGRKRSIQNTEHSVAIGTSYAALRSVAEYQGRTLTHWQGDQVLNAPDAYDRLYVPGKPDPLPIAPDATCLLDGKRIFVEVDRGTRPLHTWGDKALAYHAYRGNPKLAQRYSASDFTLLVVAPTAQRLARIAQEIATAVGGVDTRYLFLLEEYLNPSYIRANWQVITKTVEERRIIKGRSVKQLRPILQRFPLWGEA